MFEMAPPPNAHRSRATLPRRRRPCGCEDDCTQRQEREDYTTGDTVCFECGWVLGPCEHANELAPSVTPTIDWMDPLRDWDDTQITPSSSSPASSSPCSKKKIHQSTKKSATEEGKRMWKHGRLVEASIRRVLQDMDLGEMCGAMHKSQALVMALQTRSCELSMERKNSIGKAWARRAYRRTFWYHPDAFAAAILHLVFQALGLRRSVWDMAAWANARVSETEKCLIFVHQTLKLETLRKTLNV